MVRARLASVSEPRLDGGLAVLLTAIVLIEVLLSAHARGPVALNVLGVAGFAAPAAFSRRRPAGSLILIAAAATLQAWALTPLNDLVTPFAVLLLVGYRLGAVSRPSERLLGCLLLAAGTAASTALEPGPVRAEGSIAPVAGLLLLAVGAGVVSRRGLLHARSLDAAAAAHEDRLEAAERRAIASEQSRISRELHDELAHALTVVVLQAGAAQRVWDEDPVAARLATGAVAEVARAALTHLRSTLAVLSPMSATTHGLTDLRRLVDLAGGPGLDVALDLDVPDAQDAEIEHLVVRVVQEALTNAARHAGPSRVRLSVRRVGEQIVVQVRNAPTSPVGASGAERPSALPAGSGTGLRGLRHQIEGLGGTLRAGPCADGGFLVEALLPSSVAVGG